MKNHFYSDYLDNEQFLEQVEKYTNKHDNFDDIKDEIRREVSSLIHNCHGDQYDINDYLAQAKSLLDVLVHINDTVNED